MRPIYPSQSLSHAQFNLNLKKGLPGDGNRWLDGISTPNWTALSGAVVIAAMLFTFVQVVQSQVLRGKQMNQSAAAHTAALLLCSALPGQASTAACRLQLKASEENSLKLARADISGE